jgi:hypothetical protein
MTEATTEIATRQGQTLSFEPCWFNLPPERTADFLPKFVAISVAVQATLRRAVPRIYFEDLQRFRDTRMAYPLLVYAASRPYRADSRTDYTYDIVNPALMRRFYHGAALFLPGLLQSVYDRLNAAGMHDVAKAYRPENAREIIQMVDGRKLCRRRMEALIFAETMMVDNLIPFAGCQALPRSAREKRAAKTGKLWMSKLLRLYARKDFTSIATEVLDAATQALRKALNENPPPQDTPTADLSASPPTA